MIEKKHKTAIILGNGPSLRGFDFARELEGLVTFGMNAAYRYWDMIQWYPTYYSCLDIAVGFSHKEEIARLIMNKDDYGIKQFILRVNVVHWLQKEHVCTDAVINFDFWHIRNKFTSYFLSGYTSTGALTTLWAASMGYDSLILLGIDANFPMERLPEAQVITRDLPDVGKMEHRAVLHRLAETPLHNQNFFFDGYQTKGDCYFMADTKKSTINQAHLMSWEFVPTAIAQLKATVINANPASNISLFPKLPWEEVKQSLV